MRVFVGALLFSLVIFSYSYVSIYIIIGIISIFNIYDLCIINVQVKRSIRKYIGITFLCIYSFAALATLYQQYETYPYLSLQITLLVAISDVAQYWIGSRFGENRLGWLSPRKTWEGYLGALLIGIVGMIWLKTSFIYILAGCIGDLFVSGCKRILRIKDTSGILGSHGGWLDRVDSIYLAWIVSLFIL